jgi:hypothetical protein
MKWKNKGNNNQLLYNHFSTFWCRSLGELKCFGFNTWVFSFKKFFLLIRNNEKERFVCFQALDFWLFSKKRDNNTRVDFCFLLTPPSLQFIFIAYTVSNWLVKVDSVFVGGKRIKMQLIGSFFLSWVYRSHLILIIFCCLVLYRLESNKWLQPRAHASRFKAII